MEKYKVLNNVSYHTETSDKVVSILDNCLKNRTRIRVHYGDIETGKDWMNEFNVTGYVGHSTGSIKIPLLVYNSRCYGSSGILDHCIIKIVTTKGKNVLYQHPNYHTS